MRAFIFLYFLSFSFCHCAYEVVDRNFCPLFESKNTKNLKYISYFYPIHERIYTADYNEIHFRPFLYSADIASKNGILQKSAYLLYPFGSEMVYYDEVKWNVFFGLIHCTVMKDRSKRNFWAFPFYFYRTGYGANYDHCGVFPLGGNVKNFLWKDEIAWCGWPLFVRVKKNNELSYWFPWPFLNRRTGNGSSGFGVWPIGGHFYKTGSYDERYFMWPLFYNNKTVKNGSNSVKKGFLPLYAYEENDEFKDLTIVWPIWGRRWDFCKKYEEHRLLWPFFVQVRGSSRHINRWAPFYSNSKIGNSESTWYLWPFFKKTEILEKNKNLKVRTEQFLYFLFWKQTQSSISGDFFAEKTHFWPICSYWNNGNGDIQFQMLSPFEVFFQSNEVVRKMYSPIFAFYRYSQRGQNCRTQSVFWNFVKEHKTEKSKSLDIAFLLHYMKEPGHGEFELLNGFLGYTINGDKKIVKFLWKTFSQTDNNKRRRCLRRLK